MAMHRNRTKPDAALGGLARPEPVAHDVFRIRVPLPRSPLRELNSYVIVSGDRPLVVDVGFDLPECYEALTHGLGSLSLSWDDVDVLFTHGHPDHCGLVNRVVRPGVTFFAGFEDFRRLRAMHRREWADFRIWFGGGYVTLRDAVGRSAMDGEDGQARVLSGYDDDADGLTVPPSDVPLRLLEDGGVLRLGSRRLRVMRTTGHAPDHVCLYDPAGKALVCGDQVLAEITPVVASFELGDDALGQFISSAERLAELDVAIALPGHGDPIGDFGKRVAELTRHHMRRADEVAAAVRGRPSTLRQVAKSISWNSPIGDWDDWPLKQKFFSMGETLSHLSFLEAEGMVSHEVLGGQMLFSA